MIEVDFPAYIELGPERLFHLLPVTGDVSTAEGTMRTGPWVRDERGFSSAGSLGVLADDVLGYSVAAGTPRGYSTVTTTMHLDILAPIPTDGRHLHCRIDSVAFDSTGATAAGRVYDDAGTAIALGTLRGRFLEGSPAEYGNDDHPGRRVDPNAVSALGALGGQFVRGDGPAVLQCPISERVANVKRNMHGGMTLCALELAGTDALSGLEASDAFVTASIDVVYLRGAPMGEILKCTADVVHSGRSLSMARVDAYIDAGKPIATATVVRHRVS